LLARLFRFGDISYHGGFIKPTSGVASVVHIDPAVVGTKSESE
jgi:hypothetical protein